jgi:hypothetical protein
MVLHELNLKLKQNYKTELNKIENRREKIEKDLPGPHLAAAAQLGSPAAAQGPAPNCSPTPARTSSLG